jgi:hypothetical protein
MVLDSAMPDQILWPVVWLTQLQPTGWSRLDGYQVLQCSRSCNAAGPAMQRVMQRTKKAQRGRHKSTMGARFLQCSK